MELQRGHTDSFSNLIPFLGRESIYEESFLPTCKRGDVVGEFGHNLIWNRPFRHGLPCLAISCGDGISVEVDVTNTYGFDVTTPEPCRHS